MSVPVLRLRLLPVLILALAVALAAKAATVWRAALAEPAPTHAAPPIRPPDARLAEPSRTAVQEVPGARRSTPSAQPAPPPPAMSASAGPPPAPLVQPDPELAAERALLGQLRARRAEIEARERDVEAREVVAAASERRLAARVEELARLVQQLEALERGRQEREEAGWRGLVRLYEGMRPRDAAAIFDELEMPVLVEVVDRMREAKAAPVLGAMRPERARLLTTELARHRAERPRARAAD